MDIRSDDVGTIGCTTNLLVLVGGWLLFAFSGIVPPNMELFFYTSIIGGVVAFLWLVLFGLSWDTNWGEDGFYILFGCLIAGGVTLGGLYYFGNQARTEAQKEYVIASGLDKHLADYLEVAKGEKPLNKTYLVGKVVVVEMKTKKFDPVMFDLPEEIWAGSHKEVGTVIQILRKEKLVGHYSGGGGAAVLQTYVRIIDFKQKIVLSETLFQGSAPPSKKSKNSSGTGSSPYNDVVHYITFLKREKESIKVLPKKPAKKKKIKSPKKKSKKYK